MHKIRTINFFFLRKALYKDDYWVLRVLSYLLEKNISWGNLNVIMNH